MMMSLPLLCPLSKSQSGSQRAPRNRRSPSSSRSTGPRLPSARSHALSSSPLDPNHHHLDSCPRTHPSSCYIVRRSIAHPHFSERRLTDLTPSPPPARTSLFRSVPVGPARLFSFTSSPVLGPSSSMKAGEFCISLSGSLFQLHRSSYVGQQPRRLRSSSSGRPRLVEQLRA